MIDNNKIAELAKSIHETAVKHGWHEQQHSPEHWKMMIITEISELIEANRKSQRADVTKFLEESVEETIPQSDDYRNCYKKYIDGSMESEMADVCIRIMDMAEELKISLQSIDYDIAEADCNEMLNQNKSEFTRICFYLISFLYKDNPEINLSYIFCFMFALAKRLDIDLQWHIREKNKYNQLRPFKHGNKLY